VSYCAGIVYATKEGSEECRQSVVDQNTKKINNSGLRNNKENHLIVQIWLLLSVKMFENNPDFWACPAHT